MIKKFVLLSAMCLSLAGCNGITPEQIAQIQSVTARVCGFVPTAVSIADFIPGAAGVAEPVGAIASAICAVVNQKRSMRRGRAAGQTADFETTAMVNGQPVRVKFSGHFVGRGAR